MRRRLEDYANPPDVDLRDVAALTTSRCSTLKRAAQGDLVRTGDLIADTRRRLPAHLAIAADTLIGDGLLMITKCALDEPLERLETTATGRAALCRLASNRVPRR
ncbi:hypothetical protein EV193_10216 [Herbihabitans rhizosphaerae]|uniref:Uncharacterized protein n=1 Tax=Herbihabitans rhizosphaerae TaxID=1872711 RepID=A0A4Q7L2V5_9PSEU|nr:hypothetical protein [Herbihabitans rhizosphaerae]RZS43040.1 hypothetical protein EV193_10216 [Herbihabitans rhizosphaerae]